MKIISKERIDHFIETHKRGSQAAGALRAWLRQAMAAEWENPEDLKVEYPKARPVGKGSGVAVFNIKGNHFRLVARINYQARVVRIEFIGTHKEYDKIDVGTVTWKT